MDSDSMDTDTTSPGTVYSNLQPPTKVRKKPGRKPNPASPALRKAQNRAAQRAFRERKELHLKELESAMKQVRQERDQFASENEQLKSDNDTLKSENWYLKGIVLSLQLVCLQHNLTVPPHGPYINEQSLAVLAQSIPEPIATYFDVNSKSKIPILSKFTNVHARQRDRYVQPTDNYTASTLEDTSTTSSSSSSSTPSPSPPPKHASTASVNLPELTSVHEDEQHEKKKNKKKQQQQKLDPNYPHPLPPISEKPPTSNLAAIQALRLRLRLQAACVRMSSLPFAIQPTLLQLTVPHDPRIDLIPTPHMRDRMILFRDQFSLDDCFRCLLTHSVFHGGDPAIAANWQLPPEFFEKYWFLTIDWSLHRMTNQWRRMQGLEEVPTHTADMTILANASDLSSFLGIDLGARKSSARLQQQFPAAVSEQHHPYDHHQYHQQPFQSYPASLASSNSSSNNENDQEMFSNTPIQLTSGYWGPPQKHLAVVAGPDISKHGKESLLYTI